MEKDSLFHWWNSQVFIHKEERGGDRRWQGGSEGQGEGRREGRDDGGGGGKKEKNFSPYLMSHKNLTQTGS